MLGNKWMLALAMIAVVSVVLVGTGTVVAAEPGDPGNASQQPVECRSELPVCDGDHQQLICKPAPGMVFGEWMCVGSDQITPYTCADLSCASGYQCRMVQVEPGLMKASCVEQPGQGNTPR